MRLRTYFSRCGLVMMTLLFAFAALGCKAQAPGRQSQTTVQKGEIMSEEIYPTYFANPRRSSYIPTASNSSGVIDWKTALRLPEGAVPNAVLIWKGRFIVETINEVYVYSRDGKFVFRQEKNHGAPLAVAGDFLFTQDRDFWLTAFNAGGDVSLEQADFPNANSRDYSVSMFVAGKDDFAAVIQFNGGPEELESEIFVEFAVYGDILPQWQNRLTGTQSGAPLYIPEIGRIIVFTDEIIPIDAKTGAEQARLKFPFTEFYSGSADVDGTLYMTGSEEGKAILVAMAPDGNEKWRFIIGPADKGQLSKQPPVIGAGGLIHVPSGRTLKTIQNGRLVREFTIEERTIDYCTALADGSVLISAKNTLYRADADGKKIYGMLFDHDITTPPVVDAQGHVYIATAFELMRID